MASPLADEGLFVAGRSHFVHYSVHLRKRILQRLIIFALYALAAYCRLKHAAVGILRAVVEYRRFQTRRPQPVMTSPEDNGASVALPFTLQDLLPSFPGSPTDRLLEPVRPPYGYWRAPIGDRR